MLNQLIIPVHDNDTVTDVLVTIEFARRHGYKDIVIDTDDDDLMEEIWEHDAEVKKGS